MSDRRPENDEMNQSLGAALWQWGRHRELPESADAIFEAAEMVYAALNGDSADLISVVRAGVESGTIKGEVVGWCDTHNQRANMVIEKPACYHRLGCQVSHRLVLPDGGEK